MSTPVDFAAEYAKMNDGELVALARDYSNLTEAAQQAIRNEFARRKIEPPISDEPELVPEWSGLVTVGRFRDLTEATVAQSALGSAGIAAYLFDENLARMDWFLTNSLGGIRLKVPAENENAAKELLAQPSPASIPFSDTESYEQPHCPKCGSINISFNGASRSAALVGLYVAGIPLPTGSEVWSCGNCDARWEQTDD